MPLRTIRDNGEVEGEQMRTEAEKLEFVVAFCKAIMEEKTFSQTKKWDGGRKSVANAILKCLEIRTSCSE
jgi:hypothetical protein